MEKYIFDRNNGLWYELQGEYYIPCLALDAVDTQPIGMWGRKHLRYIKEHHPALYTDLLTNGKLSSYLAEVENSIGLECGGNEVIGFLLSYEKPFCFFQRKCNSIILNHGFGEGCRHCHIVVRSRLCS